MSQYGDVNKGQPDVRKMYQELVQSGLTPKDAAKQVQEKTGRSAVTGREIVKKVEFTNIGNVKYAGQYPSPKR